MASICKHSPGLLRTFCRVRHSQGTSFRPKQWHKTCCSGQSTRPLMSSGHAQAKEEDDFLKYEREYSPTKRYTSSPMTVESEAESKQDGEVGPSEEQRGSFGLISDKYTHKFQPLGTDLVEELEDTGLGEEWVKPVVKRNSPIWYGNQMKKLVKEGKLSEALEILEVTMLKEAKVQPTEFNYNVLIGACGRAGYTDKAFKLYNRMKERGLEPTSVTYTGLLNACSESPWRKSDGLTRLKKLHQQLSERSVKLNLITHHAMMKAYGRCGDLQMTFKLFRHLLDQGVQLMPKSFSFLLVACAEDKEAGFLYAIEAWRQMLAQGIKPNAYLYNLLLRITRDCSIGDIDTANRVLLRPVQPQAQQTPTLTAGSTGSAVTSKGGRSKMDKNKLERMKTAVPLSGKKAEMVAVDTMFVDYSENGAGAVEESQNVELPSFDNTAHIGEPVGEGRTPYASRRPDTSHHENQQSLPTSGSGHWWDAGDARTESPETFQSPQAQNSLESPPRYSDSEPHALTVTHPNEMQLGASSLQAQLPNLLDVSADFSNVQSLAVVAEPADRLALLGGAQRVLDHMTQNEVKPDVKGLSLLADILPRNKEEENQLLEYVEEHKIKVDVDFYNVFIRRRTRRRDLALAKDVLPRISENHLFPNLRTYVNLAMACYEPEEGFQLLQEMEEAGIEPTCHIYGALIGSSQQKRNYGYLTDILKHMETQGVVPNERVITQLEKVAAFGQNKITQSKKTTRPINKKDWNNFRGFYVEWLSRMKIQVPEHPWSKFRSKQNEARNMKFHETAV